MRRAITLILAAGLFATVAIPVAGASHEVTEECKHEEGDPVGAAGCAAYDAVRHAPHLLPGHFTSADSNTCQGPIDTNCTHLDASVACSPWLVGQCFHIAEP